MTTARPLPAHPLPTRAQEDYRYADLTALASVWPVVVEEHALQTGETGALIITEIGAEPTARMIAITLGAGAKFDLRIITGGPAYGRIQVTVSLADDADFTLGAVQLAGGNQTLEIVTELHHQGENATSRQVVRNVAAGASSVSYLGKVCVARGADGTDAGQSVRAMLLAPTAQANARPELEIYADDVKCAHGCAVGELDATALFYLAQRGIAPAEARRLMVQAFVAEALIGAEGEEQLMALVTARLAGLLEGAA